MDYFFGEHLFSKQLSNGLQIFVLPKKDYNKVYALYSTHYGSIDSEFIVPDTGERLKVPEGIAHFLEHKMFEKEYGSIFDKFAKLGASSNAYTNYTNTTYLFSATSHFEENLKLLLELVEVPYFTKESVEKEKGIITQELRMYEDEPDWQLMLNLLKCLYKNHPVRIDIGGTVESIQKIKAKTLYKCYNTFYHPSNMVLFVTGSINPDDVFELVAKHEESRDIPAQGSIKRIYPEEPETVNKTSSLVKLDVSEPMFLLGFKDNQVGYDGTLLLKNELIISIILNIMMGRSSKFYEELYEQGLIDDRFSLGVEGQRDYCFCLIGGETRDPDALYNKIMEHIKTTKQAGILKDDFERVKKKFIGNFISGFNSLEFIANVFVAYYHKNINIFDYIKVLREITYEDVAQKIETFFDFSRHATSTVVPK